MRPGTIPHEGVDRGPAPPRLGGLCGISRYLTLARMTSTEQARRRSARRAILEAALDGTPADVDTIVRLAHELRAIVPFDGSSWFGADPDSALVTSPTVIENVAAGDCQPYWDSEFQVVDALPFRALARARTPAGSLYDATGGQPLRSTRHRRFHVPRGIGDELRVAFRVDGTTWGFASLYRSEPSTPFTAAEVQAVADLSPVFARIFRHGALKQPAAPDLELASNGILLFDADGTLLSLDDPAEGLLDLIPRTPRDAHLPPAVTALVGQIGAVAPPAHVTAQVRVRAGTGRWLCVQATRMHRPDGGIGPTAVTLGPVPAASLAPLVAQAYGFTPREDDVTRLIARGYATQDIAQALSLSPHTVRDHVKAVFEKAGVSSRGQLVATIFNDVHLPVHLAGEAQVVGNG